MNTNTILLPRKPRVSDNKFHWKLGNSKTTADSSTLYISRNSITGDLSWVISAGTGTLDDENYFGFFISLPHKGNELLKGVYHLQDDLTFRHQHSIPAPPGFTAAAWVDADTATLNVISYDPKLGIAEGTFEGSFKGLYRLNPKGTFVLKESKEQRPRAKKAPAVTV